MDEMSLLWELAGKYYDSVSVSKIEELLQSGNGRYVLEHAPIYINPECLNRKIGQLFGQDCTIWDYIKYRLSGPYFNPFVNNRKRTKIDNFRFEVE